MPNKRISELELVTKASLSDSLPIVNNGTTKRTTIGNLLNSALPVSASSISGSTIHSEEYYINGNKLYNYASFSDNRTQSASINTATSILFNTNDLNNHGISITSGSRITFDYNGVYNIQFSAQLERIAGSGTVVTSLWLAYTGSNVPNTNTDVVLDGNAGSAATVAAWNFVIPAKASDWVELKWSTPDANIVLFATGSRTSPTRPATPSIIATVTQVA